MCILFYHIHQSQKGGIKEKMKNFRKSKRGLSPVVASIILIAVTVAVSIAVAAWMGALSVGFMQTEQLQITNAEFTTGGTGIVLSVRNTGTSDITISSATINGVEADLTEVTIAKNTVGEVNLGDSWSPGYSYQIRLLSAKGTWFPYNAVAP